MKIEIEIKDNINTNQLDELNAIVNFISSKMMNKYFGSIEILYQNGEFQDIKDRVNYKRKDLLRG